MNPEEIRETDEDAPVNDEADGGQDDFAAAQAAADKALEAMDNLSELGKRLLQAKLFEKVAPLFQPMLGGPQASSPRFSSFPAFTPGPETFGGEQTAQDWKQATGPDDELRVWAAAQQDKKSRQLVAFRDVVAGGLHFLLEKLEGKQPPPTFKAPVNPLTDFLADFPPPKNGMGVAAGPLEPAVGRPHFVFQVNDADQPF